MHLSSFAHFRHFSVLSRMVGGCHFFTVKFASISHPFPVESMRLILNS